MGEEVARLEGQLDKTSYQLLAAIESLEQTSSIVQDLPTILTFIRRIQSELVSFTEEFPGTLATRVSNETKSETNKAWLLQARKKARDVKDYTGLTVGDNWETMEKAEPVGGDEDEGGSPLPAGWNGGLDGCAM